MQSEKFPVKDAQLSFPHAFLLAASAGSGKTYSLSNRYIQFLLSPEIKNNELSNMLAITFTENATKEMKGRIIKFLKEVHKNPKKRKEVLGLISLNDEGMALRADEALDNIFASYADFNVGTIDSFILKILSVSLSELGVSFDYEVVFDNEKLIESALPSFFSSFKVDSKNTLIDDFLLALNNSGNDKFIFNPMPEIKKLFCEFMKMENKYLLDIKSFSGDLTGHFQLREKMLKKMIEMAETHKDIESHRLKGVKEILESKKYSELINIYNPKAGFYKANIKKVKEHADLMEQVKTVNDMLKEYYKTESVLFYRAYCELYLKFKKTFYALRKKDKTISLSQITADISRNINQQSVPEIYLKLAARLKHFLIDEFQDTNLAQWDILRPLIEDSLSGRGSLFLIGDVKQAIYMFRNADYRIMSDFLSKQGNKYLNTASLGEKGVLNFSLDCNYRSAGEIVNYVNNFFNSEDFKKYLKKAIEGDHSEDKTIEGDHLEDKAIKGDPTGLTSSKQNSIKGRENDGYVRSIVIEPKKNDEEDSDKRFKQEFIKTINDMVKRFNLEDIAVLVKRNKDVEEIVGWLSEAGIQASSFSSLDIRKRKIISELISLLSFLNNPADDLAFASFISSDIFFKALKKDSVFKAENFLFSEKKENKEEILYPVFRDRFPEIWKEFFEEIFAKSGYLTCYELVNFSIIKFNIYNNFEDETAFLLKFLDIVHGFNSSKGENTIVTLLKEFEEASLEDERFSVRLPEFIPAVRVMTFHKAKGLGFKAVINIFDQDAWKARGGEKIYYENQKEAEKSFLMPRKITGNMPELVSELKNIKEAQKKDEEIQNLNTFYVALTRAEEEMVNIVKVSSDSKKLFSIVKNYEKGNKKRFLSDKKNNAVYLKVNYSKAENIYDFIKNGEVDSRETLRGNIYHRVLSCLKFAADEKDIFSFIEKACDFYAVHFSDEEKKEAAAKIKRAINSNELTGFFSDKKGRTIKTEAEFVGKKGRILRVDRLIEDEDSVYVIDYKTGEEADYDKQMKIYMETVSLALRKKSFGLIYYLDSGICQKV